MLLWEHVIVGYIIYSLLCYLSYNNPPDENETFLVIFGSILPDIIDKPLAWKYDIFETGYALGHSIFLTCALTIIIATIVRVRGWERVGIAFYVGWILHTPLDILHYSALGRAPPFELALWPVRVADGYMYSSGLVEPSLHLIRQYLDNFKISGKSTYMWGRIGIVVLGFLFWLSDSTPLLRKYIFTSKRLITNLLGLEIE